MATSETMILPIEVRDRFSGPLGSLRNMLAGINANSARGLQTGFETAGRAVTGAAGQIRGVLVPALAAAGISSLSLAGAITAVGATLRGFSQSVGNLSLFSREVGIATQTLRALEGVARGLNISPDQLQGAIGRFAEQMQLLRRGMGDSATYLLQVPGGQAFAAQLRATRDNEQALGLVLGYLERIRDVQARIRAAEALGGRELARLVQEGDFSQRLERAKRDLGPLGQAAEANARTAQQAFARLESSWVGLRDAIGSGIAEPLSRSLDLLRAFLTENREGIARGLASAMQAVAEYLRSIDWQALGNSISGAFATIRAIIDDLKDGRVIDALGRIFGPGGRPRDDAERRGLLQWGEQERARVVDELARTRERRGTGGADFGEELTREERDRLDRRIQVLTRELDELNRNIERYREQIDRQGQGQPGVGAGLAGAGGDGGLGGSAGGPGGAAGAGGIAGAMGRARLGVGAVGAQADANLPPGAITGGRVRAGRNLAGTDQRITDIVTRAAEGLPPGYTVQPTSGHRHHGRGFHPRGMAQDWQIVDPQGRPVRNRGEDTTGLYTRLARNAYGIQERDYPGLTGRFQWGGAFGTSGRNPGEPDLMHFDIGGRRGRIGRYSREAIGATVPGERPAGPAAAGPLTPPVGEGAGGAALERARGAGVIGRQSRVDGSAVLRVDLGDLPAASPAAAPRELFRPVEVNRGQTMGQSDN